MYWNDECTLSHRITSNSQIKEIETFKKFTIILTILIGYQNPLKTRHFTIRSLNVVIINHTEFSTLHSILYYILPFQRIFYNIIIFIIKFLKKISNTSNIASEHYWSAIECSEVLIAITNHNQLMTPDRYLKDWILPLFNNSNSDMA